MNQLNKLIQQYERENPGETAYVNPPMNLDFSSKFTRWLASRPTCGKEQRKFLDEVENRFNVLKYMADDSFAGIGYSMSATKLMKEDLQDIDLQKVLKGE